MIKDKTVFILGAGASVVYGFPTGEELKNEILRLNIDVCYNAANEPLGPNHSPLWKYIFDKCGKDIIFDFMSSFKKSGKTSVDAFIEHRREFLTIGKILISLKLINYENEDSLFNTDSKDNWYEYIYGKLNSKYDDFDKNNVSFITFNYDRSLEHYLLTCIKYSYDKSEKEAADTLQFIPIIHLYGTLGHLPALGNDKNNRPFNQVSTSKEIETCIDNIKIIHEGVDLEKDKEFNKAYKLITDARMICFLGFGYDEINLSRLKLQEILSTQQLLFGSTFGLTPAEIDTKKFLIESNKSRNMSADETGDLKCRDYLRSIPNFL